MTPKRIWKFELPLSDHAWLKMPAGARILTLQSQYDAACMWALVDPDQPVEERHFRIYGTGLSFDWPENAAMNYLGTAQFHGGGLVLHVFEETVKV